MPPIALKRQLQKNNPNSKNQKIKVFWRNRENEKSKKNKSKNKGLHIVGFPDPKTQKYNTVIL
ncbi:MAG: hypothetical protein MJ232_08915 [archaeon]|nr:hypothetical protein [archaeon]